jgi:hypothetical protein
MLDNPALIITLMCLCFPGLLPIIATFIIARNYDLNIQRREIKKEEIEV